MRCILYFFRNLSYTLEGFLCILRVLYFHAYVTYVDFVGRKGVYLFVGVVRVCGDYDAVLAVKDSRFPGSARHAYLL